MGEAALAAARPAAADLILDLLEEAARAAGAV
jgi:hypothetical protein